MSIVKRELFMVTMNAAKSEKYAFHSSIYKSPFNIYNVARI